MDEREGPTELRALCETLRGAADGVARKIVRHWDQIAEAEPWHALPDDLDFDHLPELIRALSEAALCTDFDRARCRRVVELSATHGEHRAGEGFDDALLYREYHLLRRALWQQMKAERGENAGVYYATMRVDALISLANSAALHGLNREALEREGRWPDVLDQFLDEWPLPGG